MTPEEFSRLVREANMARWATPHRVACSSSTFDDRMRRLVGPGFSELVKNEAGEWSSRTRSGAKGMAVTYPIDIAIINSEHDLIDLIRVICAMGG